MTKAATEGQKRRRKAGRPSRDVPREPSGRPSRAYDRPMRREEIATLRLRCEGMGLDVTEDNLRRVDCAAYGTRYGRCLEAGWFDVETPAGVERVRDLHDAFAHFARRRLDWARAAGLPPEHPFCCVWAREAVSAPELAAHGEVAVLASGQPLEMRAALRALSAAEDVLSCAERDVANILLAADPGDWWPRNHEDMRAIAISAAKALARHFGLRM